MELSGHNLRRWLLVQKLRNRGVPQEEFRRFLWLFDNQEERKRTSEELN